MLDSLAFLRPIARLALVRANRNELVRARRALLASPAGRVIAYHASLLLALLLVVFGGLSVARNLSQQHRLSHQRCGCRLHQCQQRRPVVDRAVLDAVKELALGSLDAAVELGLLLLRQASCKAQQRAG